MYLLSKIKVLSSTNLKKELFLVYRLFIIGNMRKEVEVVTKFIVDTVFTKYDLVIFT